MFRGNKTKSIRAPSITELFLPRLPRLQFATDPCDKINIDLGTAPATREANCAAAAGFNPCWFLKCRQCESRAPPRATPICRAKSPTPRHTA